MIIPILIGAGLLHWAKSENAVRNIYIGISCLVIYFLVQDYNDSRREVLDQLSYGCINNNTSVDATVVSEQQELD